MYYNMVLVDELIGSFGRYQLCVCIMVSLNKFCVAFHQLAIIFLAPPVQYQCPGTDNSSCCEHPIYNKEIFIKTIVMEWNLICTTSWLKDLTQTLFQFGVLVGSFGFGILSDRFGRRHMLNSSVILQVFTGVAAAFAPDFWSFTVIRFFIGVSVGGMMVVGFVLLMEIVGTDKRAIVSALYQLPFTLGNIVLCIFGFYLRDYSHFQLAISLTSLFLLPYICLLPESPRYLLVKQRLGEVIPLTEKIAKFNNMPIDRISEKVAWFMSQNNNMELNKGTVIDLFKTPNLRKNILIMSFNWFVCSYCFYGVSQYISHLSGNIFVNVAASGGVSAISVLISIPLMKYMGRKKIVIISNLICGICLITIAFIPQGKPSIVLGCFGVLSSFVVFVVVYLYCSEMFPTVVRNAAIGICSVMARIGSMLAPFVIGLMEISSFYPPIVFGVFPLLAAASCIFLPETKNCELMSTIAEGERFGKRDVTIN